MAFLRIPWQFDDPQPGHRDDLDERDDPKEESGDSNHPAWQRILDRVRHREDALPKGPTGDQIVAGLWRDLATLQEGLPMKQPSTQAQAREDCAADAAEDLARAFYADRKLKIDSLPVAQQIQFHSVIAAGLDTLLREAVERA